MGKPLFSKCRELSWKQAEYKSSTNAKSAGGRGPAGRGRDGRQRPHGPKGLEPYPTLTPLPGGLGGGLGLLQRAPLGPQASGS